MTASAKRLSELSLSDLSTFGGKAVRLGQLYQHGFPVPDVLAIVGDTPDNMAGAMRQAGWWFDMHQRYAVRSSAVGEDGLNASFAGQNSTFLNVPAQAGLLFIWSAIGKVQVVSKEATAYAEQLHTSVGNIAVILQPMVRAFCAGVAFTRHPVSHERLVYVEAVLGLGDKLVNGEVSPCAMCFSETGKHPLETPRDRAALTLCEPMQVAAKLAHRAERVLGWPVDMEWAADAEDKVYVLQARPITA